MSFLASLSVFLFLLRSFLTFEKPCLPKFYRQVVLSILPYFSPCPSFVSLFMCLMSLLTFFLPSCFEIFRTVVFRPSYLTGLFSFTTSSSLCIFYVFQFIFLLLITCNTFPCKQVLCFSCLSLLRDPSLIIYSFYRLSLFCFSFFSPFHC